MHVWPLFINSFISVDFPVPGPPVITIFLVFKRENFGCKNRNLYAEKKTYRKVLNND